MRVCPICVATCEDTHRYCAGCGADLDVEGQASVRSDPAVGRTLPGGYRVQQLVAVGGMGRIYVAEQTALGRAVAVKIIHPHLVGDEASAARFIAEARMASQLSHPNSVAVLDFGQTEDGQLYLVMEYLRGRDLARVAYEEGPLPVKRIVDIAQQALAALEDAHAHGIVHRDLKPENVVLEPTRSGRDFVKVVDYGLAKARSNGGPALTSPGFVCGTPEYMSPEQGRGEPLDGRADVYGLGVLLFQLLTGRLPFEGATAGEVLAAHLHQPIPDPCALSARVPRRLGLVVQRALAKDPAERYGSARELSEALADAVTTTDNWDAIPTATAMRCSDCGALNPLSQKFCGDCGVAIPASGRRRSSSPPLVSSLASPAPIAAPEPPESELRLQAHADRRATPVDRRAPPASPAFPTPAQAPEPRPAARVACTFPLPLVGRDAALAWLDARREHARVLPCAARVVGPEGAGKTRLLEGFLLRCLQRGDAVVCIEPESSWAQVSGHAAAAAVRRLAFLPADGGDPATWEHADPSARGGLEDLFGRRITTTPAGAPGAPSPEARRASVANAIRWAIARRAQLEPETLVVLAIDDLDTIDGVSRAAITDVMVEPPLVRVLLVSAQTTIAAGSAPEEECLTLGALDPDDLGKLDPGLVECGPLLPLMADQILRWRGEHGDPAPESLHDLVAERIQRLDPTARRVVHALASGLEDEEALRRALPPPTDLADALESLEEAGLVRGTRLAHPAFVEIVQAGLPGRVRAELHGVALDLAAERGAPLELRALHAAHARRAFQSLILLDQAAQARADRGDQEGAIAALRRGLDLAREELFRGELDDPLRAVILFGRKLADALAATGRFADAEGVLREALGFAPPNDEDRVQMLASLARIAHGRQNQGDARTYLAEALRLARRSDARELVASLERLERAMSA